MNDVHHVAGPAPAAAVEAVPDAVAAEQPAFLLHGPGRRLRTQGARAWLPAGPAMTLGARAAAFFSAAHDGPGLLVGALPFDPDQDDALHQPRVICDAAAAAVDPAPGRWPAPAGPVHAEPDVAGYAAAVADAVARLRTAGDGGDALHKVVLARSLRMEAAAPIDPFALAARLGRDPAVTAYVAPLPVASGDAPAWLVGASPELLVSRRGREVVSHPLAGSARRHADSAADRRAGEALLASHKDLEEHRHVVEAIVDALAPLCDDLHVPARPSLQATATMWHLGTPIAGRLRNPSVSAAALAGLLHPTPAVCGTPRRPALARIRALEPVPRGFYAGAVGWSDASGDGAWYVAIRCARVQDRTMRLFAGAGIVADSQPRLEVEETAAKFRALLDALGMDEPRVG
ncbi:isochorismate synthase [Luteimonas abyssi]|uniref:isochorismate synthase n=1 Tax=Luteimonas abyssi TaxID=1247514 RepID=UPI000737C770|nr:isochorismate synthase [Luteimonas abyssi]